VEIDEIDAKILRELTKDARTRLKDIAKICGLSSNAIFKRVKRLKVMGVITGTILFSDLALSGYEYTATVGINLKGGQEREIVQSIRKIGNLVALSHTVGEYDICAFIVAKSMAQIDYLKQIIRRQPGIERIAVSLWITPHFSLENIDMQTKRAE